MTDMATRRLLPALLLLMFIDGLRASTIEHASSSASRSDALPGEIELPNQLGKTLTRHVDVKQVLTIDGWCLFRGTHTTLADDAIEVVVAIERETPRCYWRADRPYVFSIGLEPAEVAAILQRRHSLLAGLDAWQGAKVDRAFAELRAKVATDGLPLSLFRENGDAELSYHVAGMEANVSVKQEGERLVITKLAFGYVD